MNRAQFDSESLQSCSELNGIVFVLTYCVICIDMTLWELCPFI